MTARDFCYWLQGYFEVAAGNPHAGEALTFQQVDTIKRHLAMVFVHEIDPSAGDAAHQQALNHLHHGHKSGATPRC